MYDTGELTRRVTKTFEFPLSPAANAEFKRYFPEAETQIDRDLKEANAVADIWGADQEAQAAYAAEAFAKDYDWDNEEIDQ
jgi:hypothetical protein